MAGDVVRGPAIIWETTSTTFVPDGRTARRGGLRRIGGDMTGVMEPSRRCRALRDLDDDEFRIRYRLRPLHRDRADQPVPLRRRAHGEPGAHPRVLTGASATRRDLCAIVSGPPELGYPMAAVSETMPLFYGSIPDAVRIVFEEYGADGWCPGDVLMVNDYYRVGTHLNDVCLHPPVFHEGRDRRCRHDPGPLPRHGRHPSWAASRRRSAPPGKTGCASRRRCSARPASRCGRRSSSSTTTPASATSASPTSSPSCARSSSATPC